MLYLERRQLCLFFIFICLFVNVLGEAANWEVHGRVIPVIYYTPEEWLIAGQDVVLGISSRATIGNSRLTLAMNGLDVRWRSTPFANPLPNFSTGIWDLTLRMDGRFTEKMTPFTLEIGTVRLNYSPFSIRTDGSRGNPYKRGISISGLNWWRQNQLNAFVIWDGSQTKIAYGAKAQLRWDSGSFSPIFVRYTEGVLEDASGVKRFKPITYEIVNEFNFSQAIGPTKLDLVVAQQEKNEAEPASIFDLKTSYRFSDRITISGGYRNFSLDFDPRFRDRTPRFEHDVLLAWNPVDRYKGKKGIYLEVVGNEKNNFFKLTYDRYAQGASEGKDTIARTYIATRESGSKYDVNLELGHAQKISGNLNEVTELTIEGLLLSGRLGRKFMGNKLLELELTYIKDDSFTDTAFYSECLINYRGLMGRMTYDVGLHKKGKQKITPYVNVSLSTSIGINFTARYSLLNTVEPDNLWYDIFDRQRIYHDNILRIETAFYF